MHIEELHLEVTRNCTLECEHCLRGDKECINMAPTTLDAVFKDIKSIEYLLITGGEPFLAIEQLERLVKIIKERKIGINKTNIITNMTILNNRILKLIEELENYGEITISISTNIFHQLELERLGLTKQRNSNIETFKNAPLMCRKCYNYGQENTRGHKISIRKQGRAEFITSERLNAINARISPSMYILKSPPADSYSASAIADDNVTGVVTIDVHGNIVKYGQTFKAEDHEAELTGLNVKNIPLRDAIRLFINGQTINDYQGTTPKRIYALYKAKINTNSGPQTIIRKLPVTIKSVQSSSPQRPGIKVKVRKRAP